MPMSRIVRKPAFCICQNKSTHQLCGYVSAFVFASQIAQSLLSKSLATFCGCTAQLLYSPVCVGPCLKPRRPVFSCLTYNLQGGNEDDDDESGDIEFGNFTAAGTDFSQESSSQDPFSQSQDIFTQLNPQESLEGTILSGDKLLAQPYKVSLSVTSQS